MLYIIPFIVFLVDFLTKLWIVNNIAYGTHISITTFLNIAHVKNFGISYGLFSTKHPLGSWIFTAIIILVLFFLINVIRKTENKTSKCSLLFVMGGALGNLFDRVYYGSVVDFLDFHLCQWHWYVFNIADCAIVAGIIVYGIVESFTNSK